MRFRIREGRKSADQTNTVCLPDRMDCTNCSNLFVTLRVLLCVVPKKKTSNVLFVHRMKIETKQTF